MRRPEPSKGGEEQSTGNTPIGDNNTLGNMIQEEKSQNATPLLGTNQEEDNTFLDIVKEGYPEDPVMHGTMYRYLLF